MSNSPHIVVVNANNFESEVLSHSMKAPVVIEFLANGHPPCMELGPLLDAEAEARDGAFLLAKLDIEQNQELAAAFKIQALPTVLALVDGRPVDGFEGSLDKQGLHEFLDRFAKVGPAAAVEESRALQAEGKFEEALAVLESHLEENLDDEHGRLLQTRLLLDLDRIDDATEFFECLEDELQESEEGRAIRARLDLKAAAADLGDLAQLEATFAQDQSTGNRFALAQAQLAEGLHEAGLEHLVHIVATDRAFEDDAARKLMLETFDALGPEDQMANDYRYQLQMLLFV